MHNAKTVSAKSRWWDGRVRQKIGHVSRNLKTGVKLFPGVAMIFFGAAEASAKK